MDFKTRMKLKMLETNMGYQTPASLPLASSGQNHHTTQPANGVSTVLLPRYMKVCAVGFDDFVGTALPLLSQMKDRFSFSLAHLDRTNVVIVVSDVSSSVDINIYLHTSILPIPKGKKY